MSDDAEDPIFAGAYASPAGLAVRILDLSGANGADPVEVSAMGAGGLSGAPVRARSTEVIRYLRRKLGPSTAIIGVGGIDSAASAREKMEAGADLVQVYTGLVYKGPALVRNLLKGL